MPSDAGYKALLPLALQVQEEAQAALDEQLWEAAKAGDVVAIERLAAEGASADAKDEHGNPAVFVAAKGGHTAAVDALLQLGADPDATNPNGGAALMYAALSGHADAVAALLQGGAAVDAVDSYGVTALMAAAFCGDVECARLLVEAGADTRLQGTGGGWERKTALELADGHGQVAVLLRGREGAG